MELADKVRFEIAVSDEFVQAAIDALCEGQARARSATAKIFVLALEHAIRIRTGESDGAAVTPVGE